MYFGSVYSSSASGPSSRPSPLCFTPPNGYMALIMCQSLTHTVPDSSRRAIPSARTLSVLHTPADRPYSLSFAIATASSSSRWVSTTSTGPKISSRAMRMSLVAPVRIVGATQCPSASSGSVGTSPWKAIVQPSSCPSAMYFSTRAFCLADTSGPRSEAGFIGSPSTNDSARATSRPTNSS